MRGARRLTATAVMLGLVLTGCSGEDGGSTVDQPAASGQAGDQNGTEQNGTEENGDSDSGAAATPHPADLKKALATVSTTAVEPAGGPLDIALLEASVVGELLRVRIAYVPKFDVEETNAYNLSGGGIGPDPYLVDPVNLKLYSVVSAGGTGALENDTVFTKGNDEQPIVMTHYFAAPPEDVDELSLSFGGAPWPGFDVTVSR